MSQPVGAQAASSSGDGHEDAGPRSTSWNKAKPFACDQCKNPSVKKACDMQRPECGTCKKNPSKTCTYTPTKKKQDLEAECKAKAKEIEELRRKLEQFEGISGNDSQGRNLDAERMRQLLCSLYRPASPSSGSRLHSGSAEILVPLLFGLLFQLQHGGRLHGTSPSPRIGFNLALPMASLHSILPARMRATHNVWLPTEVEARSRFEDQFAYIGTIFAFADRASFDQLLVEVAQPVNLADPAWCLARAKYLAILALGDFYSVNQSHNGAVPGFEYFAAAVQLLPDMHEQPSIRYVETLCLIGYFMQNLNHRAAAFFYVGLAVRMAISLGLHENPPALIGGCPAPVWTEEELEHRRRAWWSVYSMDRILSVKSGNPLMIHDEDIGVTMPSRLPSEPPYCPAVALACYTQLSRILGDIARLIYRRRSWKSTDELQKVMGHIMMDLDKWYLAVPPELKFDAATVSRESVSTMLHYYQCINMTVRPFVYTLVQCRLQGTAEERALDWREGLSEMTQHIVNNGIDAARRTIHIMTVSNRYRLGVANFGYMDTEHVFSAAIMLLMVCAAFPPETANEASLRDAFDLLRRMWGRGNQHMGERYLALQQLAAGMLPNLDLGSAATEGAHGSSDMSFDWDTHMSFDWDTHMSFDWDTHMSTDEILASPDGMGSPTVSAAASGLDQVVWNATLNTCGIIRN